MLSDKPTTCGQTRVFTEIKLYVPTDWGQPKYHFGQAVYMPCCDGVQRLGTIDTIYFEHDTWKYTVSFTPCGCEIESAAEDEITAL